jgi:hypothetical protein
LNPNDPEALTILLETRAKMAMRNGEETYFRCAGVFYRIKGEGRW